MDQAWPRVSSRSADRFFTKFLSGTEKHFWGNYRLYRQDHSRGRRLTTTGQPTVGLLPLKISREHTRKGGAVPENFSRQRSSHDGFISSRKRRGSPLGIRRLARGEDGALGGGIARHGRDFLQVEASDEHGRWCDAPPAIQLRLGAKKFHFGAKRKVENNLGGAAIELLRELQDRLFAEVLPVGRTPDRDVERFLFNLVGDLQDAEKGAGSTDGNIEGLAVGIRKEFGFRG